MLAIVQKVVISREDSVNELTLPNLVWFSTHRSFFDLYQAYRRPVKFFVKTFAIIFALISTIFAFGIPINQHYTRYKIELVSGEYEHIDDPRTTGIVRYLTGEGPLPESERLPLYRQYVKNVLEKGHMPVPENIHSLSWDELNALAVNWYKKKFPRAARNPASLQALINKLFEEAVRPPLKGFGPKMSERLWQLLIAVGSPRIRWIEEQDEPASRLVAYSANDKQTFYDPITNTIFISYNDSVDALLDEVCHAKQFQDRPWSSSLRLLYSLGYSFIESDFNAETARDAYQENYTRADSLEGEAHGKIKEALLKQFGLKQVEKHAPKKL